MTLPDGPGSRPSRTLTWVEKVRAGRPNIFDSRSRAVHSDSISTTPFSRKAVTPRSAQQKGEAGAKGTGLASLVVSWRFLTSRHVRELIYLLFFSNSFSSMRDGTYSTKSLGHVSLALRKRARASGRSTRRARYSPT